MARALVPHSRLSRHLHLDQRRLKQHPQRFKFVHRGHHQDRNRRFGLQQNRLMRHGLGAQRVVRGLDEGIFEG